MNHQSDEQEADAAAATTSHAETSEKLDWQSLFVTAMPSVRRAVERVLGSKYGMYAEDVVMDTFVRLLTYKPSIRNLSGEVVNLDSELVNAKRYLVRVARNVALDRRKELERLGVAADADEVELLEDPRAQRSIEDAVYDHELEKQLVKLGGRFTELERLILTLYLSGHSVEEMAGMMGADVRVARYELNKLLAKIRYRIRRAIG